MYAAKKDTPCATSEELAEGPCYTEELLGSFTLAEAGPKGRFGSVEPFPLRCLQIGLIWIKQGLQTISRLGGTVPGIFAAFACSMTQGVLELQDDKIPRRSLSMQDRDRNKINRKGRDTVAAVSSNHRHNSASQ